MSKRRSRRSAWRTYLYLGLAALVLLAGLYWYAVWQQQPPLGRWVLGVASAIALFSSLGCLVVWRLYRREQRRRAWQRALAAQRQNSSAALRYTSAHQLSPRELEQFAAQVYRQMGYTVTHTGRGSGDHGIDVRLVNPDGQIELVQCKQWKKPVGEPEIRDLYGVMTHEGAVRGIIWAPGGFTPAARRWAAGKPIVLADNVAIGRLVESGFA